MQTFRAPVRNPGIESFRLRVLKRFATLSRKDQLLLLQAFCLLVAVRIALYILPFRTLLPWALRSRKNSKPPRSADNVAAAVSVASRYVPRATCLTRALVAQALLCRSGHDSAIKIGVTNESPRGFEAHAWVVCEGKIVIGGEEAGGFHPLGSWPARS